MRTAACALTAAVGLLGGHAAPGGGCSGLDAAAECAVAPGLLVETGAGEVPATVGTLRSVLGWHRQQPGVEQAELVVAAPNEGRRTRVVLLRLDPTQLQVDLVTKLREDYRAGNWTVDAASDDAIVALNAGQFTGIAPWGWTVRAGRELRAPGVGPLSTAVVIDSTGAVRMLAPGEIEAVRAGGGIRTALQSYPTLLEQGGVMPEAITTAGLGVDVPHRDARLAIGQFPDGRLLLLLTRFDVLGGAASSLPFGLTLRETAALLRGVGAVRAVALDGGISAQMMVRDSTGAEQTWHGWRKVPAGLEFKPKAGA